LTWEDSEFIFRPFKNEEELFYTAQQYNNCLAACRDGICDGRIIMGAFAKEIDGSIASCPTFVFEVTPYLDIVEISTYNNIEVTDPELLEKVRTWKKSKWYLLSNGRNVYRDPETPVDTEETT
jgi:hypothetical protein